MPVTAISAAVLTESNQVRVEGLLHDHPGPQHLAHAKRRRRAGGDHPWHFNRSRNQSDGGRDDRRDPYLDHPRVSPAISCPTSIRAT